MTKDEQIDKLWESSNHGTMREDIVAAYEAGAAAERERLALMAEGRTDGWHSLTASEIRSSAKIEEKEQR